MGENTQVLDLAELRQIALDVGFLSAPHVIAIIDRLEGLETELLSEGALSSQLYRDRVTRDDRITTLEAENARLRAALERVCQAARGRDASDAFPRSQKELQKRMVDIGEIVDAALAQAPQAGAGDGWRPTSEELRQFTLKHDHLAVPIRPGVTVSWTDEETGEVFKASLKGRNVVPLGAGLNVTSESATPAAQPVPRWEPGCVAASIAELEEWSRLGLPLDEIKNQVSFCESVECVLGELKAVGVAQPQAGAGELRAALEELQYGYLVNHTSKWVKGVVDRALSSAPPASSAEKGNA